MQRNLSAQSRDAAQADSGAMEFSGLVAGALGKRGGDPFLLEASLRLLFQEVRIKTNQTLLILS